MDSEMKLAKTEKEINEVLRLRKIIFVKGQHVPIKRELDGLDTQAKHVIVKYKGKSIGCARIRFIGSKAKLERIGILAKFRGKGFGKRLTKYLIRYCKRKNVKEIIIHAQYYLKK